MYASRSIKSNYAKFLKGGNMGSLKEFARKQAAEGDKVAEVWLSNKSGVLEKVQKDNRFKNKGVRISAEKFATKLARSKKSGGKKDGKKSATTDVKKVPAKA